MAGRVVLYVDGFNLYNGLKDKHGRKYLWLNLEELARRLALPTQRLVQVNYYSARVRGIDGGPRRQATYLDALRACCPLVTVIEGRFQEKEVCCRNCGHIRATYEEKETDVNIAVALVEDAVRDRYDTAILVSADSDLCPAIRSARRLAPGKRFIAAFPPRRASGELRRLADGSFPISDSKIRKCLLPDQVTTAAGVVLKRPDRWQ